MELSFRTYQKLNALSEAEYVSLIESIDFDRVDEASLDDLRQFFKNMYTQIRDRLALLKDELAMEVNELVKLIKDVMRNPSFLKVLKAFGFSIKKMIVSVEKVSGLLRDGLMKVCIEINKTKLFDKLNQGLITVDHILASYPILKKLSGPMLAGVLLVGWINMTFIGNAKYDFDWSKMWNSVVGGETFATVLGGAEGTMFLALLGFGVGTGISVAWFGLGGNIIFAVLYTAYTLLPGHDSGNARKLKIIVKKALKKQLPKKAKPSDE